MRRMTLTAKQKQEYLTRIRDMSNDDLLWTCINDGRGDDYDGCFTRNGEWKFDRVMIELVSRLKKKKFLDKDCIWEVSTKE